MKQYRPSIGRQKKRYSIKLTMERARGDHAIERRPVPSNQEEWIAQPRSLSDAIAIADHVAHAADGWRQG